MAENEILNCRASEVLLWGIDPLNGFFNHGKLADRNMQWIIPNVVGLIEITLKTSKCKHVITADNHKKSDKELEILPEHCMEDTDESLPIDEVMKYRYYLIPKNTTNSFIGTGLKDYLMGAMPRAVVVYGVCSNICVMQGVISLSAISKEIGLEKIIVPMDCVTTFGPTAESDDEYAFNILRYVPRVEVIPSYKNLIDAIKIN